MATRAGRPRDAAVHSGWVALLAAAVKRCALKSAVTAAPWAQVSNDPGQARSCHNTGLLLVVAVLGPAGPALRVIAAAADALLRVARPLLEAVDRQQGDDAER